MLVGPGTTLLNVGLGASLGERVGWPAERVRQITAEKDALLQLAISNERNRWSCDTVSRTNAFIAERAQVGEIAALRGLKDQREPSGQPVGY